MADELEHDILHDDHLTLEHRVMKVMVVLSLAFLLLVAVILPQTSVGIEDEARSSFTQLCIYGIWALWAIFVVEFVIQGLVFKSFSSPRRGAVAFGAILLPPLRIAVRPGSTPEHLWIPFLGWRRPNKALRKQPEKHFSAPMMLVALLILPILGLEFIWTEQLESRPWLHTIVNVGTRVIWLAFAIEFLVMVSISKRTISYCKTHWIDLAIIVLPMISFLRVMRFLHFGRLVKLQKMSKLYRLRGLAVRALRAILILRVLDRTSHRFARIRLEHLKSKLQIKEEEIEELHVEIAEMKEHVEKAAEKREARAAQKAAKEEVANRTELPPVEE